jgi:predicted RND superfamily exporter protein
VFEKLARFDNKHRVVVIIFMLATTAVLSLGLLNIRLETDPQSLWVSHDSQGYKE